MSSWKSAKQDYPGSHCYAHLPAGRQVSGMTDSKTKNWRTASFLFLNNL